MAPRELCVSGLCFTLDVPERPYQDRLREIAVAQHNLIHFGSCSYIGSAGATLDRALNTSSWDHLIRSESDDLLFFNLTDK
jgi:hypothetical protein